MVLSGDKLYDLSLFFSRLRIFTIYMKMMAKAQSTTSQKKRGHNSFIICAM